eukprot:TRINITY_DN4825_c0_g3_i3.p1 TRINITY_DN4825_c0_g3~~TRINITY_DN4825_c0_g3_i3.p1  ORF type:complete len:224 (-),score=49.55 TRINITY_DN4825_c0_g3_i3:67-738(-)
MGCGASFQGPFTQVVPCDEAELCTDNTHSGEPKQSFDLNAEAVNSKTKASKTSNADIVPQRGKSQPKQSFFLKTDIVQESSKSEQKQSFALKAHVIPEPANAESKQSFVLNAGLVPEPANAVSFKSFFFEPSPDNYAPGRPIMPCAPSHRRHFARLKRMLRRVNVDPKELEVSVKERRLLFDARAKLRDSIQLEERERLRTLLLNAQQEMFEQQKATEAEHMH